MKERQMRHGKRFVWLLYNDKCNSNTLIGCLFKHPDVALQYVQMYLHVWMSHIEVVTYGIYRAVDNTITHSCILLFLIF